MLFVVLDDRKLLPSMYFVRNKLKSLVSFQEFTPCKFSAFSVCSKLSALEKLRAFLVLLKSNITRQRWPTSNFSLKVSFSECRILSHFTLVFLTQNTFLVRNKLKSLVSFQEFTPCKFSAFSVCSKLSALEKLRAFLVLLKSNITRQRWPTSNFSLKVSFSECRILSRLN